MRWLLTGTILLLLLLTSCTKNEDPKQGAIRLLATFSAALTDESQYLEVVPSCIKPSLKIAHDKLDIPYLKLFKAMDFNVTPVGTESLPAEEDISIKQSGNFAEVTFIDKDLKRFSFVMVLDRHKYKFFLNTKIEQRLLGAYTPTLTPGVSNPPKVLKNKPKGK